MTPDQETAWLDWRDQGLGASDVPALLGRSSFGSPWSLWCDKLHLRPRKPTTTRQRAGQLLEDAVTAMYEEQMGVAVVNRQRMDTHPTLPWARATIDGETDQDPPVLVEVKTDGEFSWPNGPSPRIWSQCQWQMFVTGLDRCHVACLHAGFRFEVYPIDRDQDAIDDMVDRATRFWEAHVITGVAPPVDSHDATREAIGDVWPEPTPGKAIEVPAAWLVELADLKEAISGLYDEKNRIDAAIRERMEDAEIALVGGVPYMTLRTQPRTTIDADALRRDHPELAIKYQVTTESRQLRKATKKLVQTYQQAA